MSGGDVTSCRLSKHLTPLLQTVPIGQKMDLVFSSMQLAFLFGDSGAVKGLIRKASVVQFATARSPPRVAERPPRGARRRRLGAQEPAEGV